MSKGSKPRPILIDEAEFERRWEKTFESERSEDEMERESRSKEGAGCGDCLQGLYPGKVIITTREGRCQTCGTRV